LKKLLLPIYLILTLSIFSCSKSEKEKTNISSNEVKLNEVINKNYKSDKGKYTKFLNFGVTPWANREQMQRDFAPLIKYLSEKLNINVNFTVADSYSQLQIDLKDNKIDIASFSPAAFVDALDEIPNSMTYLCTMLKDNKVNKKRSYYIGYIIVRADSNIRTVKDIKDKSIGFTNRSSASGYRFPLALLLKNGVNPKKYSKSIFFLGNHDAVIEAVANGSVDIGALWDGTFYQRKNEFGGEKAFRIILKTTPIPLDAIVVNSKLDKSLISKIKSILLKMDRNTKTSDGNLVFPETEGFPFCGFEEKNLSFYNIVRETNRYLRKYE